MSFSVNLGGNYRKTQKGNDYMEPADDEETLLYRGGVKTKLNLSVMVKLSEKIFGPKWEHFLKEIENASDASRA